MDGALPRGGGARAVKAELEAVDPEFPIEVHRDVAAAFLRAMMFDRGNAGARDKAIENTAPIDDAVLKAIVDRLCPIGSDVYQFRVQDAAFLLEAFLGSERVAQALVARFVLVARDKKLWTKLDNPCDHAFHFAHALGMMRLRMKPARWREIIAPLASVKKSNLVFTERLALIADPDLPVREDSDELQMLALDILLERGDKAGLRASLERRYDWRSPRALYIAGAELLDRAPMSGLLRRPAWQQKRIAVEYGTLQHAGTARIMMWLPSGRSAKQEAAAWLGGHEAFARPILKALRAGKDAKEAALASAALEVPGSGEPVKNQQVTAQQVQKEVMAIMAGIERALVAAAGKVEPEAAAMKVAFARYCEARAAGGDCSPAAYFTRHLADVRWKADDATVRRWMDLAMEVC